MIDGVLNVYKEKGYTSHDVVAKLRGILRQKKIGHTGTLDPEAQGVLPVCLGKATRLCDMLTDKRKTYMAVLLLGRETDTQDVWGRILKEKRPEECGVDEVRAAETIVGFVGAYAQIPPMYSALKVNGKKLYELARAGREVVREPRQVTIYDIEIESLELPRVVMKVCCSKGTYIRTLCHDIGAKLGCGGCMEALTRTRVERFCLEESLTLAQIEALKNQGKLEEHIVSIEDMFACYPAGAAVPEADGLVHNGNPLKAEYVTFVSEEGNRGGKVPECKDGACLRIYDSRGKFMGIYQWEQAKMRFKPQKMFLGG